MFNELQHRPSPVLGQFDVDAPTMIPTDANRAVQRQDGAERNIAYPNSTLSRAESELLYHGEGMLGCSMGSYQVPPIHLRPPILSHK